MTTLAIAAGLLVYVVVYFTYGRKLERDVVRASADNPTPAATRYDGVDYVPAQRPVLFGHHFASIAGAAPIVGPVVAMAWGWLPALLWVWFGNIFVGAVHDYLSLMASVRYDGKSIQFVASDVVTRKSGTVFYWLVFFGLVLVIAAFGAVLGSQFVADPRIPSAYLFKIIAALILGVLMYRLRAGFGLSTAVGIVMLTGALILGKMLPVSASYEVWMLVMFVYIVVSAAIPVNVLLQPRDYLNSWLLYFGLAIGFVGAITSFHGFTAPAVTSFAPIISAGRATPFWPAIVLIIACGSLSGFHSLVASGTTSKQLQHEHHGLTIGYGAMLTEGFLSTLAIVAVAGFGHQVVTRAGASLSIPEWGSQYTAAMGQVKWKAASMFSNAYGEMVGASLLAFLPVAFVKMVAGMWVASFAMTTLDTTNRLGRYCFAEVLLPLKDRAGGVYAFLVNRWVASMVPAAIGIALAWSGRFSVLWPSFGTANQLIASMAMMTGAAWVAKRLGHRTNMTLVPAVLLWVTVTAAMIWFCIVVIPATIAASPATGWTVLVIEVVMLVLNFIFVVDFFKSRSAERAA